MDKASIKLEIMTTRSTRQRQRRSLLNRFLIFLEINIKCRGREIIGQSLLMTEDCQTDEVPDNTETTSDESERSAEEVLETLEVEIFWAFNSSAG